MKFRHVVFAGAGRGTGRVADLALPAEVLDAQTRAPELMSCAAPGMPVAAVPGATGSGPRAAVRWSAEDEAFVADLFQRAGLDARAYRTETLRRRLPACLRVLRSASIADAHRALDRDPRLISAAVSTMVIGVTGFFRDPPVFDQLRDGVLPSLANCRTTNNPLRIWSVGCSDGDEVYSLAILLAELGLLSDTYLLGTDCRADAIARAREGRFDAATLRAIPSAWVERYFEQEPPDGAGGTASVIGLRRSGRRWRVAAPLRSAVQWRTGDVLWLHERGAWDLILSRNMAMYFRPEAAGRLWQQFEAALKPGGYLVLGKAERPTGIERLSPVGPCIYRRDRG